MQYFNDFLKILFTFVIIMDPIGNIPPFFALTGDFDTKTRNLILKKAIIVAGVVLFVFGVLGKVLLGFFGISAGAFYISGGILFFTIAYEMIQSKPRSRQTPESSIEPQDTMMLAVFPLAIPLIAGPGMITTVIFTIASGDFSLIRLGITVGALIVSLVIQYATMRSGGLLIRLIGTTGMFVLEKIMGLILAALSIQLVYEGLIKLNILHG
ncbi:MarC family protein [Treponema zioleckii]|uniref:MarC family protein n=1 Tax=Treponema zioleckii TaxID=331680 RepID=UPI00168B44A4|nr:MarC family protein [Treponema zioleckii]